METYFNQLGRAPPLQRLYGNDYPSLNGKKFTPEARNESFILKGEVETMGNQNPNFSPPYGSKAGRKVNS